MKSVQIVSFDVIVICLSMCTQQSGLLSMTNCLGFFFDCLGFFFDCLSVFFGCLAFFLCQVNELDLQEFRKIVGHRMITDPSETEPYNIDWLRIVRYVGDTNTSYWLLTMCRTY